ncbi:hypothetical protein AGMMS4957_20840 [Bacteroidia bacterium]|nr:hypothetical protein AGMMS4957_20840 [Bacteroidia bacterium]
MLTGINSIKDPALHEYLDIIWEVTRSEDIFTKSRIEKIININKGRYDCLIERYMQNKI